MDFVRGAGRVAGRALGSIGGAVRKFGSFAQGATRVIGQVAAPLGSVASTIASAAGAPAIGAAIGKGLNYIAGHGQSIASRVADAGGSIANAGSSLLNRASGSGPA